MEAEVSSGIERKRRRPAAVEADEPAGALRDLVEAKLLTLTQTGEGGEPAAKKSLVQALLSLDVADQMELANFLAQLTGLELVQLADYTLDASAASHLPESFCRVHGLIPIGFNGEKLIVATADPTNVLVIDDVRMITGREVEVVVAARTDIHEALERQQSSDQAADTLLEGTDAEEDITDTAHEEAVMDAPVVKAVNQIIARAVTERASDIHIEVEERELRVRYRIDGVLHEKMRVPRSFHRGLVSRLKVMAGIDIAEKRRPQDGRISLTVQGKPIDLRVATLPTVWGEEVILRILDRASSLLALEELGITDDLLAAYSDVIFRPYGGVIVTGPTGSGKSTTLYATLNVLNDPSKKIITVEDPVEYRLPGLRQIQVHPQIGMTFATALRQILRSDPDIVMVGEIRDRETATIAVHAAMTGHMVLSTLHTKDAPSAPGRLIDMGLEPFLIASAIDCVVAQRLARKLCVKCREPYMPPREVLADFGFDLDQEMPKLYQPVGCQSCSMTGYRGRIGLLELMVMSDELRHLAATRASTEEFRNVAIEQGMRTLRQDGMRKILAGETSLEEVLRVTG